MKNRLALLFFVLVTNLFGQTKVVELTNCLKANSCDPKEYILNLFQTNDIVIIGERDHRDTTQYSLLLDIFSDERFIEEVGYIYTEVGCMNRTDWANDVLKATYENDSVFEEELIELYRELDFNPLWEKYNMYKYLKGIYKINKNLEKSRKITIGLTDQSFDWDGINRKKYREFEQQINKKPLTRDSIMAVNFIDLYEKQIARTGKRKALLIQSFPHAINLDLTPYGYEVRKTGSYIVEKYKEQVKIVAFNSMYFGAYNSHDNRLVDDGRWDAAFELTSCTPVGFDIKGTPFGVTQYKDMNGLNVQYEQLIDGIIFFTPFYDFQCTFGIPNVVDKEFFSEEFLHRVIVYESNFIIRLGLSLFHFRKPITKHYSVVRSFDCTDNESSKRQMAKWIDNGTAHNSL